LYEDFLAFNLVCTSANFLVNSIIGILVYVIYIITQEYCNLTR
jgi:hypothetical protein